MTITDAEILVALTRISDPASREICRRRVNNLGVMPKVTAGALNIPEAVFSAKGNALPTMAEAATTLKSGPRKGWPKGGLDAEVITGLAERNGGTTVPANKAPKPRRRTAAQDITGLHAADKALAEGKVEWAEDGALVPA